MNKLLSVLLFGVVLVSATEANAAEPNSAKNVETNAVTKVTQQSEKQFSNLNADTLKAKIANTLGLTVTTVTQSPMPGLVEIITDQGLFYTSYDGVFFIQGRLFELGQEVTNLTEQSLADIRVQGLKKFAQDMIVYPAENEKHVVTVFTDITCGYCRQMHAQIDKYNELGITVRYMAYPRSGIIDQRTGSFSEGFADLRSIWCHENPNEALTKAKAGSGVAQRICDKPVAAEFNFGRQVGVNSTPTIILENGLMFAGYRKPNDLLAMLETL